MLWAQTSSSSGSSGSSVVKAEGRRGVHRRRGP